LNSRKQRLLAVEPQLDRFEAQHPVDREMLPTSRRNGRYIERVEPLRVVDQDRIAGPVAELQDVSEGTAYRRYVGGDPLVAHQGSRLDDLDQVADMQRWSGRIVADIAGHDLLARQGVERRGVGHLVDVSALVE
jgi:hypothetical protein